MRVGVSYPTTLLLSVTTGSLILFGGLNNFFYDSGPEGNLILSQVSEVGPLDEPRLSPAPVPDSREDSDPTETSEASGNRSSSNRRIPPLSLRSGGGLGKL